MKASGKLIKKIPKNYFGNLIPNFQNQLQNMLVLLLRKEFTKLKTSYAL
jgi:hypothetical protein